MIITLLLFVTEKRMSDRLVLSVIILAANAQANLLHLHFYLSKRDSTTASEKTFNL